MERIKRIKDLLKPFFDKNGKKFAVATEQQILDFVEKCKQKNVPVSTWEQLVEFYGVTNGVPCLNGFDFHACDDEIIFEYWDDNMLWLGQCNDDVLWWVGNEFCIGDASNVSYTFEYEFDTLIEMLQKGFEEWF
ncbi:hypothetical protein FACS189430_04000 [Bacteroidia bacterium]|nr:hypothetical protein FACS189430_04000 [Bacteroidia bacterium]